MKSNFNARLRHLAVTKPELFGEEPKKGGQPYSSFQGRSNSGIRMLCLKNLWILETVSVETHESKNEPIQQVRLTLAESLSKILFRVRNLFLNNENDASKYVSEFGHTSAPPVSNPNSKEDEKTG